MLLLPFSSHGETDVMSWNYRSEIAVFDMSSGSVEVENYKNPV